MFVFSFKINLFRRSRDVILVTDQMANYHKLNNARSDITTNTISIITTKFSLNSLILCHFPLGSVLTRQQQSVIHPDYLSHYLYSDKYLICIWSSYSILGLQFTFKTGCPTRISNSTCSSLNPSRTSV